MLALVHADEAVESAHGETEVARASEIELRIIAEFRETLIGIVGHDLRNPLNAIMMATTLLVSGGHLVESDAQLAGHILNSGRRMKRIITQLLDFARARLGGGFPLELAHVDLGTICTEIAIELQLTTGSKLEVRRAGDLHGNWDVDRLSAMVSNIVGNAIEHATPRSTIVIDVRANDTDVTCAITNQGVTIPPDLLPRLFDPFRQGEPNTARPVGNLGLGLYIASQVVASHGGSIEVLSEGGVTTFTTHLPRAQMRG